MVFTSSSFALSNDEQQWVDAVRDTYGVKAAKRVKTWRHKLRKFEHLTEEKKLTRVNDFFNELYFVNDIKLWGVRDYWATPLEFLGSNAGDCEDYTIAKYFSLLELGIPDKKLRLAYVKAIKYNQFHMVLAYYSEPSAEPVLLDNLNKKIKPASQRNDLLPIYSFNGKNLWLMKSNQGQPTGKSSKLSLWNDLREREQSLKLNKPKKQY